MIKLQTLWTGLISVPSGGHGLLSRPLVQIFLMTIALYSALTYEGEATYWLPMIVSYLLAAVIFLYQTRRSPGSQMPLHKHLFPREVWLHPSTTQDFVMTIVTFVIVLNLMHVILIQQNDITHLVSGFLGKVSVGHTQDAPPLAAIILYIATSLAMSDLFYYISHRLTHKIPVLWKFHKVHHSAETLTPLTVYRIHPLDLWFNQCFRNVGAGLVSGLFFYVYPDAVSLLAIAATHTGMVIFYVVVANLRHSHIWISFGQRVEHVLISPALHQIHHSTNPKHFDKNFGSTLSLWDWMFGSLYVPREKEEITFGLGKDPEAPIYRSTWKMLAHPVIHFGRWIAGQSNNS